MDDWVSEMNEVQLRTQLQKGYMVEMTKEMDQVEVYSNWNDVVTTEVHLFNIQPKFMHGQIRKLNWKEGMMY